MGWAKHKNERMIRIHSGSTSSMSMLSVACMYGCCVVCVWLCLRVGRIRRQRTYVSWLAQSSAKAVESLHDIVVDKIQVYIWLFRAMQDLVSDVKLCVQSEVLSSGVWFVLGFSLYLFLVQKLPVIPFFKIKHGTWYLSYRCTGIVDRYHTYEYYTIVPGNWHSTRDVMRILGCCYSLFLWW